MPYFDNEVLEIGAEKTASFTAEVGYRYPIDLSAATGDFTVTFPSSPNDGESFGYFVTGVHSSGGTSATFNDRPFFSAEPANTTSINGSSYTSRAGSVGGGPYSLWAVGESLEFFYNDSTWWLPKQFDGRIPMYCAVEITSAQTVAAADDVDFTSTISDDMGLHSTSTTPERVYVKRIGTYDVFATMAWATAASCERQAQVIHSALGGIFKNRKTTSGIVELSASGSRPIATAGSYYVWNGYQSTGGNLDITASPTSFTLAERF